MQNANDREVFSPDDNIFVKHSIRATNAVESVGIVVQG